MCGGNHPANYRGCEYYHKLINEKRSTKVSTTKQQHANRSNENAIPIIHQPGYYRENTRSYANVTNNQPNSNNPTEESNHLLSQFLNEFKAMFNQLIQQNSMVLNMLTTLISKLVHD